MHSYFPGFIGLLINRNTSFAEVGGIGGIVSSFS